MGRTNQHARANTRSQARGEQLPNLDALKADPSRLVKTNPCASLIDLGDGCLCFEVHTKMNVLNREVITFLPQAIEQAERNFRALVIGNGGKHFGAGADLRVFLSAAHAGAWHTIETVIRDLQAALQGLRHAGVPVVAAPAGYALGGVLELAMAADACEAHSDVQAGLVETRVGLLPAGGGCLRMVQRYAQDAPDAAEASEPALMNEAWRNICEGKVSSDAAEAKRMRYLRPQDRVSNHRSELLGRAKERGLSLAEASYNPPEPSRLRAAGSAAAKALEAAAETTLQQGAASDHDAFIFGRVAHVLCGGEVAAGTLLSEQAYLDLELEAFLALCGEQKTQARIEHLLSHNRPLRN